MAISPRLEKVTFQKCSQVTNKNKVECKLGVYEEDLQILCSNANAFLTNAEILDGEIRYSGKAVFSVVSSDNNELKNYESGVEFSFKFSSGIKCLNQTLNVACVELRDVDVVKQNGVLLATATVIFNAEACYEEEIEQVPITSIDFLTKKQSLEKCDKIAKVEKTFSLQDDFLVDYVVSGVVCHTEKVCLTSSQCGIGAVIYDGEVEASIIFKTKQEANSVVCQTRRIPFRFESELGDVMPSNIALSSACVNGSNVKIYVDETKNKSTVNIDVSLLLCSAVYEISSYGYCVDAYSTTNNLKLETAKKTFETITEINCKEQKIVSDLAYFDENAGLICLLNDKIEELETTYKNGALNVKGITSVSMLLNEGGQLKCQTSLVPFEANFIADCDSVKNVTCIVNGVVIERVDQKFSCSFTLKVCYACVNQKTATILTKVEEGEKKPQNNSAISVYVASKGEDLWDVCKALNTTEEVILSSNADLAFPLEKEERILIYRELSKEEA